MRLVVLTGAGISAESGIPTFRGARGLWEGHRIEEVASREAWHADQEKVLRFYNERRKGIRMAEPNAGHLRLAEMQEEFDVWIITQNIDDLHERAGSENILHLHGEIMKARSTGPSETLIDWTTDIRKGDVCEEGYQLRPHIVWFGEMVPMMDPAIDIVSTADALAVVGTSMVVYPAAGLVQFAPPGCPIFVVDPNPPASPAACMNT
jgi:NAD-dependent deacetylase